MNPQDEVPDEAWKCDVEALSFLFGKLSTDFVAYLLNVRVIIIPIP
jgi:hypothetical protein